MVSVWFWWCMGLTVWSLAGPAFCWFAGKEMGRTEARRAIFGHPSLSRRHATIGASQPVDGNRFSA